MSTGQHFLNKARILEIAYYLVAFVGLLTVTALVFTPVVPYYATVKAGEMSKQTVLAPRSATIQTTSDRAKTLTLRRQQIQAVEKVYSVNEALNKNIQLDMTQFFTSFQTIRATAPGTERKKFLDDISFLTPAQKSVLLSLDDTHFSLVETSVMDNTKALLAAGIDQVRPQELRQEVSSHLQIDRLDEGSQEVVVTLVLHFIQPNILFDESKTSERIHEAKAAIRPVQTFVWEGQPILLKGQLVSEQDIDVLKALHLYGLKGAFNRVAGIFGICFLLFLLIERYVYYFDPSVSRPKYFLLIYVVMMICVLLSRVLLLVPKTPWIPAIEYLIPIAIVSMVLSVLMTSGISFLVGTVVSLLIACMFQFDLLVFLYLFLSNCAALFACHRIHKRTDLMKAGYTVGLVNIVLIVFFGFLKDAPSLSWFVLNGMLAFANGILCAMISFALTPYLESMFKIVTSMSLLELSNLNHPLLKKLSLEAPGTYQHSLVVANLAEAAADAIGADGALCRIGSYFHDIGKMKRPQFFTENQFSGENPHDALSPRVSVLIIASHVKDGVELASKYKAPLILKDFIVQHHGTSLVSYFYTQTVQQESPANPELLKDDFRYNGPKPQFKESGIVMLADSVEAAVRSLKKPSLDKIESLVDSIFSDKIQDGQLKACPLTFPEIETIRLVFLSILKSIYHTRINYQEELSAMMADKKLKAQESHDPSAA